MNEDEIAAAAIALQHLSASLSGALYNVSEDDIINELVGKLIDPEDAGSISDYLK